jgi:uncharacterized protein
LTFPNATRPELTRRSVLRAGLGLVLAASPLALLARHAFAQDLASAKRDGLLGERIDGLVGVVRADTPQEIRALADDINRRRRQEYARIAEREGVAVEAVAQLAGEKLIDRAGSGEWVLGADGNWRQK